VKGILHSPAYKAVWIVALAGYWLLYSFSSGIIEYSPSMVNPVLFSHNPDFLTGSFYNSGLVWIPGGCSFYENAPGCFQLNLLAGPVLISVFLSILFGFNIVLASYVLRVRAASRKLGLAGMLGVAPTLFASGMACCTAPFGALVLSVLVPSASAAVVSLSFNSSYGLVTDAATAAAMMLSFLYTASRIAKSGNSERPTRDKRTH